MTATEALLARVASGDDVLHDASPGTSGVRGLKSPRRALASLAYWAGHVGDYITTPGRREWSIGVYAGSGPFALQPCADVVNPVLTADDVTDRRATFVADPFMIRVDDVWHMFFEVMDARTRRGVIGLATSDDARRWTYRRTVLAEGFHLSYPHVLRWQGEFFMVPETRNRAGVLLYRARRFPDRWEPVATLLAGDYVDATPFRHDGRWWMPVARGCVSLHLFSADALTGPWVEHPRSPIVEGNPRAARPAGPVVAVGARRFRLAQQDFPGYGRGVRIYEMLRLSASDYSERAVADAPLIGPTGRGWNGHGMHHADVHRLDDGTWIACVDGCRSDGRPPRDQSAKGMSGSQFPVVRSAV